MDRKKYKVDKNLKRFLEKINKKFQMEKVILFGSRARGDEKVYSDYDIIMISKDFKNLKWHKRIEEIVKFWESDKDIDVLPYTPEEFEEKLKMRTMVRQAVSEGVVI